MHTATLRENGREVVLKVIRPDIQPIIRADVRLMYRLAGWVPKLLPDGRRLRPREVVREYEKTLLDELNLLRGRRMRSSCGVISMPVRCCIYRRCFPTTAVSRYW